MKYWTATLAVLIGVTAASAQTHLDSDADLYDFEVAYQKNIQTVLSEAYADDVIVRMIGEPSFFPEYVIGLRNTASGTSIFGLRTKIQIWTYQSRDQLRKDVLSCDSALYPDCAEEKKYLDTLPDDIHDIGLEHCEVPISNALAADIEDAWRLSLVKAGKGGDDTLGVDGEFYYFAMNDGGRHLGGRTWSPDANTQPGKLVSLALRMRNVCEGKRNASVSQIASDASALVRELKQGQ